MKYREKIKENAVNPLRIIFKPEQEKANMLRVNEEENGDLYRQVSIQANEQATDSVNIARIKVSSLDKIGRDGFQGVAELNLIQSIVFETAYNTNENLLIAAPTGAGKTNIAMLTILHEIRNNLNSGGSIKLKNFKVIYIAPMKALASEMTASFGKKLKSLNIKVKECTGDMQLTRHEIIDTQVIVTTPEKYDVITRKGTGDTSLVSDVRLLIIDEVHLLNEERGSVIESIVARTFRQMERSRSAIRIVGLSATLPNYADVANFLRVNIDKGLFYFDGRYRPISLQQTIVGVKETKPKVCDQIMNNICYDKMIECVTNGKQIMVFVNARTQTLKTAEFLSNKVNETGISHWFSCTKTEEYARARKSKDPNILSLFQNGFGIHHAGMLRSDRNFTEEQFLAGNIKVLCCTATLAWGVNLPAHTVVIKGTNIYDAAKSDFVDLGILDILQIFGRAGRPQFDNCGHGILITNVEKMDEYIGLLTQQQPIESHLLANMNGHLNAEIALCSVTTVTEAIKWLGYTFLYVRMMKNPSLYGSDWIDDTMEDPNMYQLRRKLILQSLKDLVDAKMVRFDERTEDISSTDCGRLSSYFYVNYNTVDNINKVMAKNFDVSEILSLLSMSDEFSQMRVRSEEVMELRSLRSGLKYDVVNKSANRTHEKVNTLIQCYINRRYPNESSLNSDLNFISQSAPRLSRYLFEISVRNRWASLTQKLLNVSKMIEQKLGSNYSPLWQFEGEFSDYSILEIIDKKELTINDIKEMTITRLSTILGNVRRVKHAKKVANLIPLLKADIEVQPITSSRLRVQLRVTSDFTWLTKYHDLTSQSFWLTVEDQENDYICYSEYITISKSAVEKEEIIDLTFTVPLFYNGPDNYTVRMVSDRWIGSEFQSRINLKELTLPSNGTTFTDLVIRPPLSIRALRNLSFEQLYGFSHFNPIQSHVFHTFYETDNNALLCSPTGSGRTSIAEMAIFRAFSTKPGKKVVYISPLKVSINQRFDDWRIKFGSKLKKKVLAISVDNRTNTNLIQEADVIITTPENWGVVSQRWQQAKLAQDVALIIIDECHLLAEHEGSAMEAIIARTNFVAKTTDSTVRMVGLSITIDNPEDVASWLGVRANSDSFYNFRSSVRPISRQIHIQAFSGHSCCQRMSMMNKPIYQAIRAYSPTKPVVVFVSNQKQAKSTASDLISFIADEMSPMRLTSMSKKEINMVTRKINDPTLKATVPYGVGVLHDGLNKKNREIVKSLFKDNKIQILVATTTLACEATLSTHIVIIKGTEYYDETSNTFTNYPTADMLQMIGTAGRLHIDDNCKAIVMVHDQQKEFYKMMLNEPFRVESSLSKTLHEHINTEIVSGTITSIESAVKYIKGTFFYSRLLKNPNYYGLKDCKAETIDKYIITLLDWIVHDLEFSQCVNMDENNTFELSPFGKIASDYYLKHRTIQLCIDQLKEDSSLEDLLNILSSTEEYSRLPMTQERELFIYDLLKNINLHSSRINDNFPLRANSGGVQMSKSNGGVALKRIEETVVRIVSAMISVCDEKKLTATTMIAKQIMEAITKCWTKYPNLLNVSMSELKIQSSP